jgi:hypothetical protein
MSVEPAISEYRTPPARRGTRRVLAVRMLAARSGWLDGAPHWEQGRVVWRRDGVSLAPTPNDLSLAQRSHYKIQRYPISADLAFGDLAAWIERRTERLALAKRLVALSEPDLAGLAQRAVSGDSEAIERLSALLEAEAVCANALPASPAATLAACGEAASRALREVLRDAACHPAAHALAALAIGAPNSIGWARRASIWGRSQGLLSDPMVWVRVLAPEDGLALAHRLLEAQRAAGALALPDTLLRRMLGADLSIAQIVEVAEALAPLADVLAAIAARAGRPRRHADRVAEVDRVVRLAHQLITAAPQPETLRHLSQLLAAQMRLAEQGGISIAALLAPAELAAARLGGRAAEGFELLTELHGSIWDLASYSPIGRRSPLSRWALAKTADEAAPLIADLAQIGSAPLVIDAYQLGISAALRGIRVTESYRLAVAIVRQCNTQPEGADLTPDQRADYAEMRSDVAYDIRQLYIKLGARHETLQILGEIAALAPRFARDTLLMGLCSELRRIGQDHREGLRRARRIARHMVRLAQAGGQYAYTSAWFVRAALLIDRHYPDQADHWLGWLVDTLIEQIARLGDRFPAGSISIAALLAAALAEGQIDRFQRIFLAMLGHAFSQEQDQLEASIERLMLLPGLRHAIGHVVAQQPQRCADLLVQVGMAARLGATALAPLDLLEARAEDRSAAVLLTEHDEWLGALTLAPELAPLAASLFYSAWVLGREPQLPAGVRDALAQPLRVAREAQHLALLVAQHPDRPALARRLANLQARLEQDTALVAAARAEAYERLEQAAALARLEAAESLTRASYRLRLEQIAGHLPDDLAIEGDLMHAAQLSLDIRLNRPQLRRLVRAAIQGERGWRELIPANARFLEQLASHGADRDAWLGAHPRRVRIAGLRGGALHLHMETDPLRVLQMGNPFGTCLALGGFNSHSAVANAVDLNKRVLFGYDGGRRIVARTLIAIDSAWRLVHFHTYTAVDDRAVREQVLEAVRSYLLWLAEHCCIPVANDGQVPTLVAHAWYDDGCVAWGAAPEADPSRSLAAGQRHDLRYTDRIETS